MSEIEAHRIRATVPPGWDARIARRSAKGEPVEERPVAHFCTRALPERRGDFGSGAVERLGPDDVLVCLIEYDAASAGSPVFARDGIPRFRSADFSPDSMQRSIPGLCGAQAFFVEAGRPFCAYVVLGSYRGRSQLVPRVNDLLAGVHIDPSPAA